MAFRFDVFEAKSSTRLAGNHPVRRCFPLLCSSPTHQPLDACFITLISSPRARDSCLSCSAWKATLTLAMRGVVTTLMLAAAPGGSSICLLVSAALLLEAVELEEWERLGTDWTEDMAPISVGSRMSLVSPVQGGSISSPRPISWT